MQPEAKNVLTASLSPLDHVQTRCIPARLNLSHTERRGSERIAVNFSVLVRGGSKGQSFQEKGTVVDFSTGGFYMCLNRHVARGEDLFAVIRFGPGDPMAVEQCQSNDVARLAVRAVVRRVEAYPNSAHGIAVELRSHRFLYSHE